MLQRGGNSRDLPLPRVENSNQFAKMKIGRQVVVALNVGRMVEQPCDDDVLPAPLLLTIRQGIEIEKVL